MGNFSPCAIVPVYNHEHRLAETLARVRAQGLPIVLVDDGSNPACKAVIAGLVEGADDIHLETRPTNGGKGAAVMQGMRAAYQLGYSHGFQIDADGQHDIEAAARMLAAASAQPNALIVGIPQFDESVPKRRLIGRYATHIWVWINTLSLEITDSMCGFRVYPLESSVSLIDSEYVGRRMDFDTEFAVRWKWRKNPLREEKIAVVYPEDGVSHFRLWQDNKLISLMHTRLFFGMLARLPAMALAKLG